MIIIFISTSRNLHFHFLCELQLLFHTGHLLKHQYEMLIAQAYAYLMHIHTCTLTQMILSRPSLFT